MRSQQIYYPESKGAFLLPKERDAIIESMTSRDRIACAATARRESGAILSPSVVIATSSRLIIVKRWMGGLRSHIAFIPYKNIVSAKMHNGIIWSSLFVRTDGAHKSVGSRQGRQEEDGIVHGLRKSDAHKMFLQIKEAITAVDSGIERISKKSEPAFTQSAATSIDVVEPAAVVTAIEHGIVASALSAQELSFLKSRRRFDASELKIFKFREDQEKVPAK